MTEREFLQQVFVSYQEVDSKLEQIARLQSLATRTTTIISGTPHGRGTLSSRVEQAIIAINGQTDLLAAEINHLLEVRRAVSDAIATVDNPVDRRILEYRYLAFKSWQEISRAMKMSVRYIYILHGKALKNFSEHFTKFH